MNPLLDLVRKEVGDITNDFKGQVQVMFLCDDCVTAKYHAFISFD